MKAILRLFRYVKFYKSQATLSIVFAIVVAMLASAQIPALYPVFKSLFGESNSAELKAHLDKWPAFLSFAKPAIGQVIDYVLNSDNKWKIFLWSLGILVVLNFLRGIAMFLQEYNAGKVHTGVSRRLAANLYHRIMGQSMSFYNRMGSPSIVSRFTNDVEAVGKGMALLFSKVLVEPLLIAAFFIAALIINWKLLLINMALFPLLMIGVRALGLKARFAMRKGLDRRDRLLNVIQETAEGISIVKAFNMEAREEARFKVENENVRRQDLKLVKADAIVGPFVEFMGFFAIVLSLVIAGRMVVITHEMDMSTFSLFYVALASMFTPIRKLSNINNRVQALVAAANRVFEVLDLPSDVTEKPAARTLARFSREIRFDNVSFSYNGSETVLDSVSLVAARGEIVALVGPSGAGKTTIARLIPRFYDPTQGRVLIDGVDVRDVTFQSLRDQIGLVTQEVILFDDTIAANIAYGKPGASRDEITSAARRANAHDFIVRLPQGYDSTIGEKGLALSGGQRQRIALARAILKDPPILILDEATSSLDSESEHLIQLSLDEFMQHRTSIVIAHRLSTVQRASRIYVIEAGRVTASGSNSELLVASATYKNLYRRQFSFAAVPVD